jgi:hypothetical protein
VRNKPLTGIEPPLSPIEQASAFPQRVDTGPVSVYQSFWLAI